jgi:collagen type III alpha
VVVDWLRRLLTPRVVGAPPDRERIDLRRPLEAGQRHLLQGPGLDVVGESRYRDSIEAAVGRRPGGHKTTVDAALVAEPDNRYDPRAIAVHIGGKKCGYLSREDAPRYAPVLAWAVEQGFIPMVRADVRGGWRSDDGTWADFGIRLYVASPEKILDPRSGL